MLESMRERQFSEAVETAENVKKSIGFLEKALKMVSEVENVLCTAAAFVEMPEDDRIMSFVIDLENMECDMKKQIERMK